MRDYLVRRLLWGRFLFWVRVNQAQRAWGLALLWLYTRGYNATEHTYRHHYLPAYEAIKAELDRQEATLNAH